MKIAEHVQSALVDWDGGRFESALTQACIAVDGTARRMYPRLGNRDRYVKILRTFYWIIEPALGMATDFEKTKFSNVKLRSVQDPDIADIIYEVFRCAHAHGDDVAEEFIIETQPHEGEVHWTFGRGRLHLPSTLMAALLFVVVLAPVNKDELLPGDGSLTLGSRENQDRFTINEWWGRSADFHEIAAKYNKIRTHIIFSGAARFEAGPPAVRDANPKAAWPSFGREGTGPRAWVRMRLDDLDKE